VTIVDAHGAPVSGATVYGHWSEPAYEEDSGVTDSNGQVKFNSDRLRKPPSGTIFTFNVGDVVKEGWIYDPDANDEESDSVTYW